ncbi:MAG: RpiB/LacA/LacB family sugar-phosphate isomerase, partial [Spirochaetes bacterium]|nr:RpiB/LacA/LacB family sugar-phosphate isomerase [Spirochaetota bacterium]
MHILIANDHGAIELKNMIVENLSKAGHEVVNLGVDVADSVDYPDIARRA